LKKKTKKTLLLLAVATIFVGSIYSYNKYSNKVALNEQVAYLVASEIPPRTEITKDDVKEVTVNGDSIPPNVFRKREDVIGKYTAQGYGLSENSHFFKDKIVDKKELPDAALLEIKEGEAAFSLLVDLETSYANSIIPNTVLNLNFKKVVNDGANQKIILGPLAENVRVVSVKDAQATDVFDREGNENDGVRNQSKTLAKIYNFAVPEELSPLLEKAKEMGNVFPIATGQTYNHDAEVVMSQNEVVDYIESVSYSNGTLDEINTVANKDQ